MSLRILQGSIFDTYLVCGGVANATGPNAMCPSSWCEGEESCEEVVVRNHLLDTN